MGRRGPAPARNAAENRRKAVRRAMKKYRAAHKSRINAERIQRRERNKVREEKLQGLPPLESNFFITNKIGIASPALLWLDAQGAIHAEDTRSAEEVIRDWKRRKHV
jgi:hypothetical protein